MMKSPRRCPNTAADSKSNSAQKVNKRKLMLLFDLDILIS
jgi:hypothetical protein